MIRTNRAKFSNWNDETPQSSDQRQHLRSTTARRAAFQSEPGLKLASGRRGRLKPGDRGPRLGAGARSAISVALSSNENAPSIRAFSLHVDGRAYSSPCTFGISFVGASCGAVISRAEPVVAAGGAAA